MKGACTHAHEEGCVVQAALKTGDISEFRYQSYCEFKDGKP